MITPKLMLTVSLLTHVYATPDFNPNDRRNMTPEQKWYAVEPSVTAATTCVEKTVAEADPHIDLVDLNVAIVAAAKVCKIPMRSMIDKVDEYYGDGAGETYLDGNYLDYLPKDVQDYLERLQKETPGL
jgi:hypothetical protein